MANFDSVKIREGLGKKVRAARRIADLTQLEVAEKAEVDPNYYSRIERGIGNPSYEKLYRIAKTLKMDFIPLD